LTDLVIGFYKFGEWLIFLITYFGISRKIDHVFCNPKKTWPSRKIFLISGFYFFGFWKSPLENYPLTPSWKKPITDLTIHQNILLCTIEYVIYYLFWIRACLWAVPRKFAHFVGSFESCIAARKFARLCLTHLHIFYYAFSFLVVT
jgi:hypothetical protein